MNVSRRFISGLIKSRKIFPVRRGEVGNNNHPLQIIMASANKSDPPAFAWIILAGLGIWDFVRGFAHTYFSQYFAEPFAGLDLSHNGADSLMLMGSFGISNFLTGAIFLVVAFKARPVVPWILALIPLTYAFGLLGIRLNATPEAAFPGRYMMVVYLGICVVTFVACVISMQRTRRATT